MDLKVVYIILIKKCVYTVFLLMMFACKAIAQEWSWSALPSNGIRLSGEAFSRAEAISKMQSACPQCAYFTQEQISNANQLSQTYKFTPSSDFLPSNFDDWEYSFSLFGYGAGPNNVSVGSMAEVLAWLENHYPSSEGCLATQVVDEGGSWFNTFDPPYLPAINEQYARRVSFYSAGFASFDNEDMSIKVKTYSGTTCFESELAFVPARRRAPICPEGFGGAGVRMFDGYRTTICSIGVQGFVTGPITNSDCDKTSPNPCNIATGDKFKKVVDFSSDVLKFSRSYNSLHSINELALGKGWRHNFGDRLLLNTAGTALGAISVKGGFISLIRRSSTYYDVEAKLDSVSNMRSLG